MSIDVVIVGAGPAGCSAAISLLEKGISVILVESRKFPRDRPGETLHPGVEPLFEKLGVADMINAMGFLRHDGTRTAMLNGTETLTPYGTDDDGARWRGYQIPRRQLDSILLNRAIALGAKLLQPAKAERIQLDKDKIVELRVGSQTFQPHFIFDATGVTHWLHRQLKLDWRYASPRKLARYGYASAPDYFAKRFITPMFRLDENGWTWIAQTETKRIAWVVLRRDNKSTQVDSPPVEIATCKPLGRSKSVDVTWRISKRVAGDNWFLLGDAAAVIDPSSSHGVLKGIMSGMMAAHVYSADLEPSVYQKWITQWFDEDVRRLRNVFWQNHQPIEPTGNENRKLVRPGISAT